jgi:hypothetical protein
MRCQVGDVCVCVCVEVCVFSRCASVYTQRGTSVKRDDERIWHVNLSSWNKNSTADRTQWIQCASSPQRVHHKFESPSWDHTPYFVVTWAGEKPLALSLTPIGTKNRVLESSPQKRKNGHERCSTSAYFCSLAFDARIGRLRQIVMPSTIKGHKCSDSS